MPATASPDRELAAAVAGCADRHREVHGALQAASLVLGYPGDWLLSQLPLLDAVAQRLPESAGAALTRIVQHLEQTDLHAAQCAYVDTFDLRRRCCLFLTYHAYGDTRKRGMALLKFTHAYKAAGYQPWPRRPVCLPRRT